VWNSKTGPNWDEKNSGDRGGGFDDTIEETVGWSQTVGVLFKGMRAAGLLGEKTKEKPPTLVARIISHFSLGRAKSNPDGRKGRGRLGRRYGKLLGRAKHETLRRERVAKKKSEDKRGT